MNIKIILTLALASSVLQVNPSQSQVVRDGLVNYWSFDAADVEGNTVKDVVGGNDGTIVDGPKQVRGKFGEAFEFAGKPDAIDVGSPTDGNLDFGDAKDFSMMA